MKRSALIIMTVVLTSVVFSGCRRKAPEPVTVPSTVPSTAATVPPTTRPATKPTTRPTTAPTTQPPTFSEEETVEGGLGDTVEPTNGSAGRQRRAVPKEF